MSKGLVLRRLIVVPTQNEMDLSLQAFAALGLQPKAATLGRLPVVHFHDLSLAVAKGGLGKVQFAIQTQHLLDIFPWALVICAGAAGALVDDLSPGDIVVSTETIEHDILSRFSKPLLPRFRGAETAIAELKHALPAIPSLRVRFGPIASGDEDVADPERRAEVQRLTGALAVAWEGAGGARACQFSRVPFVEIRGITDQADSHAASHFRKNLTSAMKNVATLITAWLGREERRRPKKPSRKTYGAPERSNGDTIRSR